MRQEKFLEFFRGFYPSVAEFLSEDDIKDLRLSLFCSSFVEFEEIVRANDPVPAFSLVDDLASFDHTTLFESVIKAMEIDENISFFESQSTLSMQQSPSQIFEDTDSLPKFTIKNDKPFRSTVCLPKTFAIRSSNPMLRNSEKTSTKIAPLARPKLTAPFRKIAPQKSSVDFLQMKILQAFSINEETVVERGNFTNFMLTKKEELDSIGKEIALRDEELSAEDWLDSFHHKNRFFQKLSEKLTKYTENCNFFCEKIIEQKCDSDQRAKFMSMVRKVANSQFFLKVVFCFVVHIVSALHDKVGFTVPNIAKNPSLLQEKMKAIVRFLDDLEKVSSASQFEHHCDKMIRDQREVLVFYQSFADLIIATPSIVHAYLHFPIKDNFCRPERHKDFQRFRLLFGEQLDNLKAVIK